MKNLMNVIYIMVILKLIEQEIEEREKAIYECAAAVDQDHQLNREMKDWDKTCQDGLAEESWGNIY